MFYYFSQHKPITTRFKVLLSVITRAVICKPDWPNHYSRLQNASENQFSLSVGTRAVIGQFIGLFSLPKCFVIKFYKSLNLLV